MPKSARTRTVNKLHCQSCGKLRSMQAFVAVHVPADNPQDPFEALTEEDKEKNKPVVFPFKLKRFLEMVKSKTMLKLPKFYAANCSICGQTTFYQGQNRQSKLQVVNT